MRKNRYKRINKGNVPLFGRLLLRLLMPTDDYREFIGNLNEIYLKTRQHSSALFCWFWCWIRVIESIPAIITETVSWRLIMLSNYIKVAFRNLKKYKAYSFINLSGLAIGMACFLLITLYVKNEFRYDTFHNDHDRLFRVIRHYSNSFGQDELLVGGTPAPIAERMIDEMAEVENGVTIGELNGILTINDNDLREVGIFAGESFFDMFSFVVLAGKPKESLNKPFTIILSKSLSEKMFADENPVGRVFRFTKLKNLSRGPNEKEEYDVTVTGIFEDVPRASHLQFEYIISLATVASTPGNEQRLDSWGMSHYYNYVKLSNPEPGAELVKMLEEYTDRFRKGDVGKYILQPLEDIHWNEQVVDDIPGHGANSLKNAYILMSIAFVILLIACINYMNLASARFSVRLKEIGLRKVIGAEKMQLFYQYMGESLFMSVFAGLIGAGIAVAALPYYSLLVGRELHWTEFVSFSSLGILVLLTIIAGTISGIYPALFATGFKLVAILQSRGSGSKKGSLFRNSLVVVQYGISIFLIASTIVVFRQIQFIKNSDIGYNRENIVVIPLQNYGAIGKNILEDLKANSSVIAVSGSYEIPLTLNNVSHYSKGDKSISVYMSGIGYDFVDVFELEIVDGRNFSREYGRDKETSIIVNEAFVEKFGLTDPVGKLMKPSDHEVIGVVKNFQQSSMRQNIVPMFFFLSADKDTYITARISPDNIPETVSFIEETMEKYSSESNFDYWFQDEYFDKIYKSDQRAGQIFGLFAGLSIFIACLGMYGLASFSIEKRAKEIAVRKVVGASSFEILIIVFRPFLKWVVIANIFAVPAIFFVMNKWLQEFIYKIDIDVWIYILSGLIGIFVTILAVGYQSYRSATSNPVDMLKCE